MYKKLCSDRLLLNLTWAKYCSHKCIKCKTCPRIFKASTLSRGPVVWGQNICIWKELALARTDSFPGSPASMILLFYFQPCSWTRRTQFDPPSPQPASISSCGNKEEKSRRGAGAWREGVRFPGFEDEEGRIWSPPTPPKVSPYIQKGVAISVTPPYPSQNSDPFILSHGR